MAVPQTARDEIITQHGKTMTALCLCWKGQHQLQSTIGDENLGGSSVGGTSIFSLFSLSLLRPHWIAHLELEEELHVATEEQLWGHLCQCLYIQQQADNIPPDLYLCLLDDRIFTIESFQRLIGHRWLTGFLCMLYLIMSSRCLQHLRHQMWAFIMKKWKRNLKQNSYAQSNICYCV